MKRAYLLFVAAAITTLGCQSQPGQFGSPFASGPTRVPPPVTGSIGTPIPQPSGAQYYPGGSAAITRCACGQRCLEWTGSASAAIDELGRAVGRAGESAGDYADNIASVQRVRPGDQPVATGRGWQSDGATVQDQCRA